MNLNSDLYSASVNTALYEISCYIRPRYKGTRLYFPRNILVSAQDGLTHGGPANMVHILQVKFVLHSSKGFGAAIKLISNLLSLFG